MSETFISIDHVSKIFDPNLPIALDNITAKLPQGCMIGMAGPDGAGKTTLLRLIAGLLLPTKGIITVDGFDTVKQAEAIHEFIGYMPQKFGLYEDLTVQQNLNLYADLRGVPKSEQKDVFENLLTFTDLKRFTDRLAGKLSGGMKQKLGLACALIQKPKLLLLDEPSVGVDPISRRELWKMVLSLLKEGITVVWSTAYLDEAERSDTVLLLNEGKLLYDGPPNKMTERVIGRTFKIEGIENERRHILSKVLEQPEIIDGVIQGADVRIVTKEPLNTPFDLSHLKAEAPLKLNATTPRFEDAFVDILGGSPKGQSPLASNYSLVATDKKEMIEADQLTKKFGNFVAADHVTFHVKKGEIFGLLGPNGAGKSTTFKMLCGLIKPNSGKAFVNGVDLQKAPGVARAQIGYMAQKFSLYGNLSVEQNLEFFAGIYNLTGRQKYARIKEMIDIFDLKDYLNENADSLPLGFKQRLALSCSVMHQPKVLFLDEPTSGVDPITRREFWNHINGLVEKGVTIMVTTHFMDEAENCDRIALIYRSKVIKIGAPDDLKNAAKTAEIPSPTLEDAFISLIQGYEGDQNG